MAEQIERWISGARQQGYSDDQIRAELAQAGWAQYQIDQVLPVAGQAPMPEPAMANPSMMPYSGSFPGGQEYTPKNYPVGSHIFSRSFRDVKHFLAPYLLFLLIGVAFLVLINFLITALNDVTPIVAWIVGFFALLLGFFFVSYGGTVILATQEKNIGKILSITFRRFIPYYLTGVLGSLIVGGGLMLFFIPGVFMAIAFSLLPYVVAKEQISGFKALQRCYVLVRNFRGAIMAEYVILSLFNLVFIIALMALLLLLESVMPENSFGNLIGSVYSLAFFVILYTIYPFFQSAYSNIIYADLLKIRPLGADPEVAKKGTKFFVIYLVIFVLVIGGIIFSLSSLINSTSTRLDDAVKQASAQSAYTSLQIYYDQNGEYPSSLLYISDISSDEGLEYNPSQDGKSFKLCTNLEKSVEVVPLDSPYFAESPYAKEVKELCYTEEGLVDDNGDPIRIEFKTFSD